MTHQVAAGYRTTGDEINSMETHPSLKLDCFNSMKTNMEELYKELSLYPQWKLSNGRTFPTPNPKLFHPQNRKGFPIPHADGRWLLQMERNKTNHPHTEINSTRAICYSRDLYNTPKDIIESYIQSKIQVVYKIKSSTNITILTFPIHQSPPRIKILGVTLNLEPYCENPKQCGNCFSYMHKTTKCTSDSRCTRCSKLKKDQTKEPCENPPHCNL